VDHVGHSPRITSYFITLQLISQHTLLSYRTRHKWHPCNLIHTYTMHLIASEKVTTDVQTMGLLKSADRLEECIICDLCLGVI